MTTKANRIERYYDTHELEGAELTQSRIHHAVIMYLMLVLDWIFHDKDIGVTGNINFYQTELPREPAKSPDIAVVEGLEVEPVNLEETPSYYIGEDGPPPRVVFEIASKETWRQDLEEKPANYYAMGVNEYFAYDPNSRSVWTREWRDHNRLIGWRKNPASGQYELLTKDEAGRLWSEELASWLVVEPAGLRLYTADGQLRLTESEAYQQQVEAARQRAEMEQRRAEIEHQKAEIEHQKAEIEHQKAEIERQRAETEKQRADQLAEMLRKLGHNPEELI